MDFKNGNELFKYIFDDISKKCIVDVDMRKYIDNLIIEGDLIPNSLVPWIDIQQELEKYYMYNNVNYKTRVIYIRLSLKHYEFQKDILEKKPHVFHIFQDMNILNKDLLKDFYKEIKVITTVKNIGLL